MGTRIPVLQLDRVDVILSEASANFLREHVTVSMSKSTVVIPKIVSWYGKDICASQDVNQKSIVRALVPYVDKQLRKELESLLVQGEFSVKVRSFKWKCLTTQYELQAQ